MLDRRDFIKASGLGGSLLLVGPAAFALDAPQVPKSGLIVHSRTPHNAEPPLDELVKSWITPNERFYIRSHAPVPKIDPGDFRLSVEGLVQRPLQVSLKQLQNEFKKRSVVATMTCAGNRRSEHSLVKKVSGVGWLAGAIGNARWGGVRLSDLLKEAGIKDRAKHVWFEGVDRIERTSGIIPFGASIPLKKAMGDHKPMPGALVVYEMNGKPLPPDHGFPMRTVVPGYIGARSVKWLGRIIVSDRPSTNHYVAKAYKLVTKGTDAEWSAAAPIGSFPINCVTCRPASGGKLKAGEVDVRGYALAPGAAGRTIGNVEISTDGGRHWAKAKFTTPATPFCWRLWSARIRVNSHTTELIVRATDSAGHVQPRTVAWNLKGYLFNAWHRTRVDVKS